jgi:hypothetical protein
MDPDPDPGGSKHVDPDPDSDPDSDPDPQHCDYQVIQIMIETNGSLVSGGEELPGVQLWVRLRAATGTVFHFNTYSQVFIRIQCWNF